MRWLGGGRQKEERSKLNKCKALKVLADIYLLGDTGHEYLKLCAIFTRSLSWSLYIRNTYDSTTAPGVYQQLHQKRLDYPDPLECD